MGFVALTILPLSRERRKTHLAEFRKSGAAETLPGFVNITLRYNSLNGVGRHRRVLYFLM
jgi:hypothetical protein